MKNNKKKYDWSALKKQFFVSEHLEVKGFFEEKCGTYNGNAKRYTKGWAREKEVWLAQITSKALDQLQDKESRELSKALQNIFTGLKDRVKTISDMRALSVQDLHKLWEIFMTMNNRATRIATNINFHEERKNEDELTEEEKIAIEKATSFLRQKRKE